MATFITTVRVREGTEAEFEAVSRDLHAATHARESNVRRYEYFRGAEPRTYHVLLSFDTYDDFLTHQTSDHHEAAGERFRDLFEDISFEWLDPVDGASGLAPTEMAPLPPGDDASPLWRQYHETMPAVVQDWWLPLRETA